MSGFQMMLKAFGVDPDEIKAQVQDAWQKLEARFAAIEARLAALEAAKPQATVAPPAPEGHATMPPPQEAHHE